MALCISVWCEGVVNFCIAQAKLWNFCLLTPVKARVRVTFPSVLFQKVVFLALYGLAWFTVAAFDVTRVGGWVGEHGGWHGNDCR